MKILEWFVTQMMLMKGAPVSTRSILTFDSDFSQYIEIPEVEFDGDFEIEFGIYVSDVTDDNDYIIGYEQTTNESRFLVTVETGGYIRFNAPGRGSTYTTTSVSINAAEVTTCIFSREGSVGTISINGVSEIFTITTGSLFFNRIGNIGGSSKYFFR